MTTENAGATAAELVGLGGAAGAGGVAMLTAPAEPVPGYPAVRTARPAGAVGAGGVAMLTAPAGWPPR
ncbi:MAG TPA: hypothetical protein VLJ59_04730 [Mycobacteriales bacterium]|nr:hypothetical protein [Mycobacteriales bacterium]